jgi:hypothetical protein
MVSSEFRCWYHDVPASPGIGAARARLAVPTRAPVVRYTLGLGIHCRLNEGAVLRASRVAATSAERRVSGGSARRCLA